MRNLSTVGPESRICPLKRMQAKLLRVRVSGLGGPWMVHWSASIWQLPQSKVMMHTWVAAGKRAEGQCGAVRLPQARQWVESQQTQGRKTAGHLPSQSSAVISGKELPVQVWFDISWLYIREMLKTRDKEKCGILLWSCTYWELNVNGLLFQQPTNRMIVILLRIREILYLITVNYLKLTINLPPPKKKKNYFITWF